MNTAGLLGAVPMVLRDDLIARYREIANNYLEHRWEPSELNGGKFAEVAYSIVAGAVGGKFPGSATKPKDFVSACRALESIPTNLQLPGDRSLRVLIPRQLVALYDVRNNRGVGHIGGDVDANSMDATAVFSMSSWTLAELVRIFHNVSTDDAQAAVDALAERNVPAVWIVPGTQIKRVLDTGLTATDQTLLLLHVASGWLNAKDLAQSVEYSSVSNFRNKVLRPMHKKRFVEFDEDAGRVVLTPVGAKRAVEVLMSVGGINA